MSALPQYADPGLRLAARRSPAVVTASDLVRRYGEGDAHVDALRGVSLEIEEGCLTAIMGPSGSGKSTLMHILAGLDKPTEGSVRIAGLEITSMNDRELTRLRREHIGFVFQFFNLLPMLTAEENVVLPLSIAGVKRDRAWVEELLDSVGIADRRTHRPSEMSGGQQQRVSIARALVSSPTVLFADEPTGNLDSKVSVTLMALFQELNDQGITMVCVTHEPDIAQYGKRKIVLRDGLVQSDEPISNRTLAATQIAAGAPA
jgi:putative ABC transport system ATP-binding protein